MDLPTISSLTADPQTIGSGESSMLSWSVSDATAVSIDHGIGTVGSMGGMSVSPATTTTYTLTATNAAGPSTASIQVFVSAEPSEEPPVGDPDLIIVDITRSGGTISYEIKNKGSAEAGASTSRLNVDGGAVEAYDSVDPLAAGASRTESFGYSYSCLPLLGTDAIVVSADSENAVLESNEANNERSESWSCYMKIPKKIL